MKNKLKEGSGLSHSIQPLGFWGSGRDSYTYPEGKSLFRVTENSWFLRAEPKLASPCPLCTVMR